MFLNGGEIDGNHILGRSTVKSMLAMQKSTDGKPLGFGLGWQIGRSGRETFAQHPGGGPGINSLLRIYPRLGLSIAVLGNSEGTMPGQVLEYTAAILSKSK
jgi:CubicO group peptidase (beta-lactamase class C family)